MSGATKSPPVCFLFPGQSSWRRGMLADAARLGARSRKLLDDASAALGRDLLAADATDAPRANRDVQVGVLLASLMHLAALEETGVEAVASLGLSLGEYGHLVHIGALDAHDALRLVDARGALYEEGPPGKMAAVFPMAHDELADAIRAAGQPVEIVNLNSPTQNVIAGDPAAVDRAIEHLDREHVVETVVIETRIAMHASAFAGVGARFRPHLAGAAWRTPRLAYRPNVDASVLPAPAPEDFVDRLHRHVSEPVHFRRSVERCVADHPGVVFVEVGPGRVLTNLLQRRWIPNGKLATDAGADPRAAIDAIAKELAGG